MFFESTVKREVLKLRSSKRIDYQTTAQQYTASNAYKLAFDKFVELHTHGKMIDILHEGSSTYEDTNRPNNERWPLNDKSEDCLKLESWPCIPERRTRGLSLEGPVTKRAKMETRGRVEGVDEGHTSDEDSSEWRAL